MNDDVLFDDGTATPRKEGMSGVVKVLLILSVLVGLMCLACCGGLFFVGKKAADSVTEEPGRVRDIASSILDVPAPEVLQPQMAMDMTFMGAGARMANFSDGGSGFMMVMEMLVPQGQMPPQGQVQGQHQAASFNKSVEQKMLVNGEAATFEIGTATMNGQEVVQISGTFRSKSKNIGTLLIALPPEKLSEEAALQLVQTLGTPQGEPRVRVVGDQPARESQPDAVKPEADKPDGGAAPEPSVSQPKDGN